MLDQQSRYDRYKDSGEIWLGDIPVDWNLESIRAVTELKSKRSEPDLPVLSVYRDYGVILKDSRDDNHPSPPVSPQKSLRLSLGEAGISS